MDKNTLKSSIKAYCLELMKEISTLGGEGSYTTKYAGRKTTSKDKTSPTGFETSPKNNYYKKLKFRVTNPYPRKNSIQLWQEIKINNPTRLETLKRGLIKILEGDKEYAADQEQIEDVNDYITYIQNSQTEEELTNHILAQYLYNDGEMVKDYINVALGKDSFHPVNESHYSKFKQQTTKPKPKEVLHRAIKEIQMKLDEVNKLIDYTTRIKGELTEGDQEIEYLNRTKNSIHKIYKKLKETFNKMSSIDEIKINNPNIFDLDYNDLYKLIRKAYSIDDDKADDVLDLHAFPSIHMTNDSIRKMWWSECDNKEKRDLILDLKRIINQNK